jgi:hypothetical protein
MSRSKSKFGTGIRLFKCFVCTLLMLLFSGTVQADFFPLKLGNPTLKRYPSSGDPRNATARSVWDMHFFNDRIYIGSGDMWNNSGVTDVWAYNGTKFENEFTVDDEMIFNFREYDKKLFIPGNDATEDWGLGNLYINDPSRIPNPGWLKLRTLPGCLHSFDIALFQNKLFANMTTDSNNPYKIVESTDMGKTWATFLAEYGIFVVFPDFLFINTFDGGMHEDNYYKYDGIKIYKVKPNLYPDWNGPKFMDRQVRFRDGVLYTPVNRLVLEKAPLFFLPQSEIKDTGKATKITRFASENVRDIVVRGNTCFVMTADEIIQDVTYKCRIYSSTDLVQWTLTTEFTVPGIPVSFEMMNNKFYVGLGSRIVSFTKYISVGPEAGSIWEVEAPKLSITAKSIDLGSVRRGQKSSSQFTVSNKGGGILQVKICESKSSLWVYPSDFALSKNESREVTVFLDSSRLILGQNNEMVTISSNFGDADISLSIKIL